VRACSGPVRGRKVRAGRRWIVLSDVSAIGARARCSPEHLADSRLLPLLRQAPDAIAETRPRGRTDAQALRFAPCMQCAATQWSLHGDALGAANLKAA
jgi:hypothetical protein